MRHPVDVALVRSAAIQPVRPFGRPGSAHVDPRASVGAPRMPQDRKDRSHPRQRPPTGDGRDATRVHVGRGAGHVVAQQRHQRLAAGDRCRGGRRGDEATGADRGEQRHRRHGEPPAKAEGSPAGGDREAHPVNCDGPRWGWRTAAAHARYGSVSVLARVASLKVTRALTMPCLPAAT